MKRKSNSGRKSRQIVVDRVKPNIVDSEGSTSLIRGAPFVKKKYSLNIRKKMSESAKKRWATISPEERFAISSKISATVKAGYKNMNQKQRQEFSVIRKKALTPEVRERIASNVSIFLQSNPDAIENLRVKGGNASRKYHSTKTEEERDRRAKAISKGVKREWASCSEEEKEKRITRFMKSLSIRPTKPEKIVGQYLDKNYPGEWKYNGDTSAGVVLAGLVPDFVNVNGKKLVIEVFGRFFHDPAVSTRQLKWERTEQGRVDTFKTVGFDCVIIWEDECNDMDLKRILTEVQG